MHHSTALVSALFFASMVVAAPVAPISAVAVSSGSTRSAISDVATEPTVTGSVFAGSDIAVTPSSKDVLPVSVTEQSESNPHALDFVHSAEKSRRRSFRRRHP
ncbi:hypothetical protein B0H10DRAFT_1381609 [Mycena sp. CBHHK59/15]|nr:hypothetical protein B0H10DRAFT_1381609 [Mycena sp. CBHHK59/15]